jgi:AraC family transcriptional regulator
LLLEGSFTEVCQNQTLECRPMSLSFLAAGESHTDHFHSRVSRCFIIDIPPRWMDRAREHKVELSGSASFQGDLASHIARKLYKEFHREDNASALAIEGLALEMMAEASRHPVSESPRQAPHWLEKARDMLHAGFSDSLPHAQIAKEVGVHPVHLAREFKRHYRCTIGEYVRRLRIEYACLEISKTDLPILQIAMAAGFYDQSHFVRTFKHFVGMTPVEYRKFSR